MASFIPRKGSVLAQVRVTKDRQRVFSKSRTFKTMEQAEQWAAATEIAAAAAIAGGECTQTGVDKDELRLSSVEAREDAVLLRERRVGDAAELCRLLVAATGLSVGPGVYLLLDERRNVVYVGQSASVIERLGGHADKSYSDVRMIREEGLERRLALEARLVAALDPALNTQLRVNHTSQIACHANFA